LSHGLILSLPNSISLILPKVEKISWRCSLFTFLVKRPMWIFVEGGDPLRARPLGPDLDLERSRGFSGAALTLGLSSLVLLSFLTGEDAGSFPAFGALALSLPLFFFLSFFVLSLLLDLLESELESLLDSELESLLELLELESLFFLLRPSLCFFFPLPLSGLESLLSPLSSLFFSFTLPPPFSCSLDTAIFLR